MSNEMIIPIEIPESHGLQRIVLEFGDRRWHMTAFDDGSLRVYAVKNIEPLASASIMLHPYNSSVAHAVALADGGWSPEFPDDPYFVGAHPQRSADALEE